MIDEKKLIGELFYKMPCRFGAQVMDWFRELVDNQPKVGKWIPCTEQLPSKVESYYIVSVKSAVSGLVYTRPALYDNHGFSTKLDEEVIAWQPLPEPYRGEGEGRNE